MVIGLVEMTKLNANAELQNMTVKNPFFYFSLAAQVSIAVALISDFLYLFVSTEEELIEADQVIDEYLEKYQPPPSQPIAKPVIETQSHSPPPSQQNAKVEAQRPLSPPPSEPNRHHHHV